MSSFALYELIMYDKLLLKSFTFSELFRSFLRFDTIALKIFCYTLL